LAQASRSEHSGTLNDLRSSDKDRQNRAFQSLLQATQPPVERAYEVWNELLGMLTDGDNRQRSIAHRSSATWQRATPKSGC
jgi:hypothetical protein